MSNPEAEANTAILSDIKARIANIQEIPLNDHMAEYEAIHTELEKTLNSVEGM